MSERIEELREIRTKVEAGEVDAGTLEQLVYGLAAEVEVRLHNQSCQRAEIETCNKTLDALTRERDELKVAAATHLESGQRYWKALRDTEDQLIQVANKLGTQCGEGVPNGVGDTLANACCRKIDELRAANGVLREACGDLWREVGGMWHTANDRFSYATLCKIQSALAATASGKGE